VELAVNKPTVVFFGNERLATGVTTSAPTLTALLDNGYDVRAVVSHNEATISRTERRLEIAELAEARGIPVLLPNKPSDALADIASFKADIGVLAAYGKIVPQSVINVFPHGIINIHPSLLPKHRGPTPLESVILDGSSETGVSVMELVSEMDAGPVYAQSSVRLSGKESKQELADTLLTLGSSMIVDVLAAIFSDNATAVPQDDKAATFDALISKDVGLLDFSKPAVELEREVRAFANWPKSRTTVGDKDIVVTKAHVQDGTGTPGTLWLDGKQFGFYTTDKILVIDSLKPAGKAEMSSEGFLAGYGKGLGL
jgi:methionyl-tRNA formyltransferase